jgi:hypothetical protein
MAEITINRDMLQQARGIFQQMRQLVEQEIVRQRQLLRQFDDAMNQVRFEVVHSPQSVSAEQLWYQVGLEVVASESLGGRINIEHLRDRANTISQELIAAQRGPVGNALRTYTDSINIACDRALSEYWGITNNLYPANTVSLSTSSWEIDGMFGQLGGWLQRLDGELQAIVQVLDRLLAGESAVEAALATRFVDATGPASAGIQTIGSALNGTASIGTAPDADVWSYLSSKYDLSSDTKAHLDPGEKTIGVSAEVSGDLWNKGESSDTKVAGVNIHDSNGIRLGTFSASAGLDASLDPNAEHWAQAGVSASFTGLELYHEDVIGSENLGLTDGASVKVLSADAFAGFQDGTLGAKVGVDLGSVEGSVGVDVAGVNVGVDASIGLKAEFGFEIGKKVEVHLPFVSFGFSFG